MRSWNSPVVNLAHLFTFLLNVAAGLFNIWRHHDHYFIWNFICAGIIVGVNIGMALAKRRLERVRFRVLGEYYIRVATEGGMTDQEIRAAWDKALANLERIAGQLGADVLESGCKAQIKIGNYMYIIVPHGIERIPLALGLVGFGSATCLRQQQMPYPELIASTLLLLKNDPTIFERWCRQDGWYA